jgi:hypothetical protein
MATENRQGLQAPNRKHAFRTYFEPTGVRLQERGDAAGHLAELRLIAIGRGNALEPVAAGEVWSEKQRVEIARSAAHRDGVGSLHQQAVPLARARAVRAGDGPHSGESGSRAVAPGRRQGRRGGHPQLLVTHDAPGMPAG